MTRISCWGAQAASLQVSAACRDFVFLSRPVSRSETPFLFCLRCRGGRACPVVALPRRLVGRITIVSASNCRGHFLFSQLRKGAWLPRSFTLSTNNPQLSPTGRGNASPVEDSPWRARTRLGRRSPGRFRVSGGLLNPSGGARNRPRNKSVLA
jgi:hypothetical protein